MKKIVAFLFVGLVVSVVFGQTAVEKGKTTRVIVLADMGNEPDEEQQIVHLMTYSNEFDLVGLIAVTGKFLNPNSTNPEKQRLYPELFLKIIDGYGKARENLVKHANGWPTVDYLKSIVTTGQPGYGTQDVGAGKSSPGSELIVSQLLNSDNRSLYVIVNAGSNTLAQALFDIQEKQPEMLAKAISKLRVFENGAQDDAGAWICHRFPNIHWVRSNYQTYCYGGPSIDGSFDNKGKGAELGPYTWKPYAYNGIGQHQWLLENIIGGHGPLGTCYPIRQFKQGGISFMEGGGTIPFLGLVNNGLYDIDHPEWGGWSGRYGKGKTENYWSKHQSVKVDEEKNAPFYVFAEEADSWTDPESGDIYEASLFAPVWRWRRAFQNDFQARMDWCVKSWKQTNHKPVAVFNNDMSDGIVYINASAGEEIELNAAKSTDPDGDSIAFCWYNYPEAGTYEKIVDVKNPELAKTSFQVPEDASGKQIHIILEARDNNPIVSLYDYRRIVVNVK